MHPLSKARRLYSFDQGFAGSLHRSRTEVLRTSEESVLAHLAAGAFGALAALERHVLPLAEIAPSAVHPALSRTIAELLAALPESERGGIRPFASLELDPGGGDPDDPGPATAA